MEGNGVWNEFNDSCVECQGENLVRSDPQVSLTSGLVVFEKTADLLKDLFHDCVLAQIIISSFVLYECEYSFISKKFIISYQLLVTLAIGGNASHDFGSADT